MLKASGLRLFCVQCPDEDLIDKQKELPFVEDVIKVWRGKDREQNQDNYEAYPLYIKNIQDYSFEKLCRGMGEYCAS